MVFKRRKISLYNGIFRINMKEFPLEIVVLSRYNFGVVNEKHTGGNCMRQYKIYEKEEKQIEKIICNMCKKEIKILNGMPI